MLESKNYRNPYKYVEGGKRTGTTRKNACDRETMVKIRLATMFIIAQAVLTKQHASGRSTNIAVEDRAVRCNRNTEASCLETHHRIHLIIRFQTTHLLKCGQTNLQLFSHSIEKNSCTGSSSESHMDSEFPTLSASSLLEFHR